MPANHANPARTIKVSRRNAGTTTRSGRYQRDIRRISAGEDYRMVHRAMGRRSRHDLIVWRGISADDPSGHWIQAGYQDHHGRYRLSLPGDLAAHGESAAAV